MKKLIISIIVILLLVVSKPIMAGDVYVIDLAFSGSTLAAGSGVSSYSIDMDTYRPDEETFGLYFTNTSVSGTSVTVKYYASNGNSTYVAPGNSTLLSGFTSGTTFFSFTPVPSRYLKIEVSEAGGKSGVSAFSGSLSVK